MIGLVSSFTIFCSISCFVAVVFTKEEDIAAYTIKAADDPRTLNKSVYITPPANTLSYNGIVSLWEKKIGKTLEKIYVPGDEVLKKIQGHLTIRKSAQVANF